MDEKRPLDDQAIVLIVEKFAEVIAAAKKDEIDDLEIGAAVAVVVAMVAGSPENIDHITKYAKRNLATLKKKGN